MSHFYCTVSDPWTDFAFVGVVVTNADFEYVARPGVELNLDPVQRVNAYFLGQPWDIDFLSLDDLKRISTRCFPMQRISAWVEVDSYEEAREAILTILDASHERQAMKRLEKAQGRVGLAYEEARAWALDADDEADLWSGSQLRDMVLDAVADRSLEGPNGWLVRKQMGLPAEPGDDLGFVHL